MSDNDERLAWHRVAEVHELPAGRDQPDDRPVGR